jgi:uncharacterized cupredoxin-like copper-binding protein
MAGCDTRMADPDGDVAAGGAVGRESCGCACPPGRRLIGGMLIVFAAIALSACGSSTPTAPLSHSAILQVDVSTRVVHLELAANETPAFSGFNFDGYGGGAMRVSVPLGWTVDVVCKNDSTTMAHSCAIVDDAPLTPFGGTIAFPGASTPDPVNGLDLGVSASFRFVATRVGTYRIACLVIGHESDGMWDWFDVTPGGLPSVHT